MGNHIVNGEFQSDKYPACPPDKVPLSVKDPTAQDLLWEYAQRRRAVDSEFSDDLQSRLLSVGYVPQISHRTDSEAIPSADPHDQICTWPLDGRAPRRGVRPCNRADCPYCRRNNA